MHVLTATSETQGDRPDDFCFTVEGELVRVPPLECCSPDRCGCGRSFAGTSSHRATTTAKVVARAIGLDDLQDLYWQDLVDQGYPTDAEIRAANDQDIEGMLGMAADLPAGTVVERRGQFVQVRRWASEAVN